MHRLPVLLATLTTALPVLAAESCATQAAMLFSEGKHAVLAARFKGADPSVDAALARLATDLGRVDNVAPLARLSEGKTRRLMVSAPGLPSSYAFDGTWASARSERQGPVEFQAAALPGGNCTLLALHVHVR